jgi:hypothetical protein
MAPKFTEECADCGDTVGEDSMCDVCLDNICEMCMDSHIEDYHGSGGDDL